MKVIKRMPKKNYLIIVYIVTCLNVYGNDGARRFGFVRFAGLNDGKRGGRLVRERPGLGDGLCRTCVLPR